MIAPWDAAFLTPIQEFKLGLYDPNLKQVDQFYGLLKFSCILNASCFGI
jgi:hypothetical protein